MTIRPATAVDAADIATVHVRSWQGAYRGLLPRRFLDGIQIEPRTEAWQRRLADLQWPRSGLFVATDGDDIVGFVDLTPTRDDDDDPATVGEVTTIYVLPQAFGQGIGRELMRAALTTMTEAGYVEATLWVLADNERAIAFYGAGGWQPDGSRKQDTIAGVPVTEIRYRHALAV